MNSQNDNGLSIFEQEHRRDMKSAAAITGLAALGVAAALGLGFVLGGRGGSPRESAVAGAAATATRTLPVSPTAPTSPSDGSGVPNAAVVTMNSGSASGGSAQSDGGSGPGASNPGDDSGADDVVPAPTNTPVPPAPTDTAVPPTATSTPIPPTNTPTATATATATATPGFEICIPCIDPGVIIHLDFTPPAIANEWRMDCPAGTWVSFDTDEDADLWVTYTILGFPLESAHVDGQHFSDTISGSLFYAHDVVFHAKDAWGNESAYDAPLSICF
jgi:hypothetical protein